MEAADQHLTMIGEAIEGVEEQEVVEEEKVIEVQEKIKNGVEEDQEKTKNLVGVAEEIIELGDSVEVGSRIIKMKAAKVLNTK